MTKSFKLTETLDISDTIIFTNIDIDAMRGELYINESTGERMFVEVGTICLSKGISYGTQVVRGFDGTAISGGCAGNKLICIGVGSNEQINI